MPSACVLLHLSSPTGIKPRIHSHNATALTQPTTVPNLAWTPFTAIDPLTHALIQIDIGAQTTDKRCLIEEDCRGAFLSNGEVDRAMQTSVEKIVVHKVRDRKKVRLEWHYANVRRGIGVWAWVEGNEVAEEEWHWWEVVRVEV